MCGEMTRGPYWGIVLLEEMRLPAPSSSKVLSLPTTPKLILFLVLLCLTLRCPTLKDY